MFNAHKKLAHRYPNNFFFLEEFFGGKFFVFFGSVSKCSGNTAFSIFLTFESQDARLSVTVWETVNVFIILYFVLSPLTRKKYIKTVFAITQTSMFNLQYSITYMDNRYASRTLLLLTRLKEGRNCGKVVLLPLKTRLQ